MNPLLVLVPTPMEWDGLLNENEREDLISHNVFFEVCGAGPAASAFMAGQFIREYQPGSVLLCGIAGAYRDSGLETTQVVTTQSEVFADLGFSENGFPVNFDTIHMPLLYKPDGEALTCKFRQEALDGFPVVNSLTVSTITSDNERAHYLSKTHRAEIENMEGAAVALACAYCGVPMQQLRSISNFAGKRDKSLWKITESLESLRTGLFQIIDAHRI